MLHMASCLESPSRNKKHEQMIELIIVLFKQLLMISDNQDKNQYSLQKQLLSVFSEESVFDSFIYLTQDFTDPFFQKISLHFLEIWYQVFKCFTPSQVFNYEEMQKKIINEMESQQIHRERKMNFLRHMRHGKFGSMMQIRRDDGTSMMVSNIYKKDNEINIDAKKQRQRP